ncbi:MAG TPA: MgtC/SapB family protein [Oscillatoriaceae cyanobacterium M33_DOE_052]|uniref:MgtC/SapB family protein n=1 Tax=Oscillatoriales cyanobacterium SpSt-418 TaxID=2282169 RepID=A0A7C3KCR7_9CYAN|nr:MgtC/SapB family protein [Oscillatoriaceae cyanobacterium M33_DOE_052]
MTSLLAPLDWQQTTLRLGVALLVGAIIGIDRQLRAKSAGLRTHMLVSLGSALFILVPIQLNVAQESADAFSRVLQGVITGVGFVGGGVILHESGSESTSKVGGVTTAAAIWIASALGIAAGCGLWLLSLAGAILSLFTLSILKKIEKNK